MSTTIAAPRVRQKPREFPWHKVRLALTAVMLLLLAAWAAWFGVSYYTTPIPERPFHPLHAEFRPSGRIGIRLGLVAVMCFLCLYLYPLRKRWRFLQRFGKTRNWLDVHVLFGLSVPVIVTLHSSFKLNGMAGLAYWIMIAIVLSGIVGRYLYSQIPRSASAAEFSLQELGSQAAALELDLKTQGGFPPDALARALALPPRGEVEAMSVVRALLTIVALDVGRPLRVAELRRTGLTPAERWLSLGGLLRSRHADLEEVLRLVQRQAWLTAKILFLHRAGEVFHLWHVVHRPFSWSFLLLVVAHIILVALMGYF